MDYLTYVYVQHYFCLPITTTNVWVYLAKLSTSTACLLTRDYLEIVQCSLNHLPFDLV